MCVLKAAVSNPNSSIDTTKNIIKNQNLTEPEKGSEPDKPATGQALAKGDGSSVSKKGQAISSFSFGVEPYNDPKPIIKAIKDGLVEFGKLHGLRTDGDPAFLDYTVYGILTNLSTFESCRALLLKHYFHHHRR